MKKNTPLPIHPFPYDSFQLAAIEGIEADESVLVSAPTGTGKTAIAEYAIYRALQKNERVVFTAPIKAISNQKYRDWNRLFPGRVGIVTGDVAIEPEAPLLIMTTEIYRNQLFEESERHNRTSLAVFDEVHYLDDYERGTVWEEALMFSRPQTRFLALSATAPNIEELASWIRSIHSRPVRVVLESHRPVKLLHYFQCQNKVFSDIHTLRRQGYGTESRWDFKERGGRPGRHGRYHRGDSYSRIQPNRTEDLIRHLIEQDRLPCLYFAFGRKRVEELAETHTHLELLTERQSLAAEERFRELAGRYDLLKEPSASKMLGLVRKGVGYHHAGLLPTLKEVVEQLFTEKQIHLIFTTETFALGVNMPARTVVFDELRKYYGFGFDHLTTRDYYQMAGRAGRRGLDTEGYVYARVAARYTPFEILKRMIFGEPEAIRSQFNASYATLINLYKNLGRKLIDVYPRSLHFFQSKQKKQKRALESIERKIDLLESMGYLQKPNGLTPKGHFAMNLFGYELLLAELWESGLLEFLGYRELAVLLAALVFEPRKNETPPHVPARYSKIQDTSLRIMRDIHQAEEEYHVLPLSRPPHFHLAQAMEAWVEGASFQNLRRHTDLDEGVIIRHFRMVIQLLRQLKEDPAIKPEFRQVVSDTLHRVNRDVVDAERWLRIHESAEESPDNPDDATKDSKKPDSPQGPFNPAFFS